MTVADLIAALHRQDPKAIVVLSMNPSEGVADMDVTTVERADISAVQLRAVDGVNEYRKRYTVVLEGGVQGVWLG